MGPRIVIVSNRVALPERTGRSGGLEVAVEAALRQQPGIWFGWSGRVCQRTEDVRMRQEGGRILIDLTREDYEQYYLGFANRVLWPILHYRIDLADFSYADLGGYLRVNDLFAGKLSELLEPDDLVWVHDYHLMPLARMLRARGHRNRMGFFLHVPCPPPDVVHTLPRHEQTLDALADYDLVGLQTDRDRDNLARCLGMPTAVGAPYQAQAADVDEGGVPPSGPTLGTFPVGIDAEEFADVARRASNSKLVRELRTSLAGRALIIGVDRLDYSKGLPKRMAAVDHLLERHPEWQTQFTFLQIAPKSREKIPEYGEIDRRVSAAAGQLNAKYGQINWFPVNYVNRAYSRVALAGLYRLARVGLVTPLRDGMNLVAKEYVAAQDAEDPGVLVLSQFAGAACELGGALIVNPYDTEGVAAALHRALEMPVEERRARHARLLESLRSSPPAQWARDFIGALQAMPRSSRASARAAVSAATRVPPASRLS